MYVDIHARLLEELKKEQCDIYRKDDCNGCFYYDPEDQVCRFDK